MLTGNDIANDVNHARAAGCSESTLFPRNQALLFKAQEEVKAMTKLHGMNYGIHSLIYHLACVATTIFRNEHK